MNLIDRTKNYLRKLTGDKEYVEKLEAEVEKLKDTINDMQYDFSEDIKEKDERIEQLYRWAKESKEKYSAEYTAVNAMRYALARGLTNDDEVKAQIDELMQENFKQFSRAEAAEKNLLKIAASMKSMQAQLPSPKD